MITSAKISVNTPFQLQSRRAVEALRSGVPNRDAVQKLGCSQPQAEAQFENMLDEASDTAAPPRDSLGMLVSGDFGSGKSHLLTYLEQTALERGFVCSKVAISKETPLYDLGKVYASAIENGRILDRSGRFIEELAQMMHPESDQYASFFHWANTAATDGLLNPMFPASLLVHERSNDLELNAQIESFWAGSNLRVTDLRRGLRDIGQQRTYTFRAPKAADLPPQRLRFTAELIKGAGYKGWVVLLDEIELIGSYSILQRGRSYAEIARWMGKTQPEVYPGLVVTGTVTDDFATVVINPDGTKKDRDYVSARLDANPRYSAISSHADMGMNFLEYDLLPLTPPDDADVADTMQKLQEMYSEAYGWDAPPAQSSAGGAGFMGRMRYKVRAAINEWDIMRIHHGSSPDTVSEEFAFEYEENTALEVASKDND